MKIPKYIDQLLEQRAKAALTFILCDTKIVKWLDKNNIQVSSDDILTGACSLTEPYSSIDSIRECILKKERK